MKHLTSLILSVAACCLTVNADPFWSDLRASFLIAKKDSFARLPRSFKDPLFKSEDWTAVSSIPNDCNNEGKFQGIQHVRKNDYSVGLLYDINGIIAGIQMLIKKSIVMTRVNPTKYNVIPMYQNATYDGQDYFVLTTYFVDPATICSTGRTEEILSSEGTGNGLWIQNGTEITVVPMKRPGADNLDWTKNRCFPAMGYHNFFKQDQYKKTNCTEIHPIFALYNKHNDLHGFGFVTAGHIDNPRFEHAPIPAIKMILGLDKTPQCVIDGQAIVGTTSLHVYFVPRPWFISCSIFRAIEHYFRSATAWVANLG